MKYQKMAKTIKQKASHLNISISYTQALELVSALFGHKNRHSLLVNKNKKFNINLCFEEAFDLLKAKGGCIGYGHEATASTLFDLENQTKISIKNALRKDWWWKYQIGFDPKTLKDSWIQDYYNIEKSIKEDSSDPHIVSNIMGRLKL